MQLTNGLELVDPASYGANGIPHDSWKALRRESPIHWCEPPGFESFWAITRHDHICEISAQPEKFANGQGIFLLSDRQRQLREEGEGLFAMRTLIEMDPPEHRQYRKVSSAWFTPRAIDRIDDAVRTSAREAVDALAGTSGEGECDFAKGIATTHPLRVLSGILGVPREQEPEILRLTNEMFGSEDPDLGRDGAENENAIAELGMEIYQLFSAIIEKRRAQPGNDLASVLATGLIDGEPMGAMETFGYYLITFTAGHDTTKNAIAGGMRALIEHPHELAKLQKNPQLIKSAVEEIVRWTAPVNYMKRTAAAAVEIGGQRFREGDNLVLFYASANRDEGVFENPYSFEVDRDPNPHLGFGIGEHFCLGASLARKSQYALWEELLGRLESVELAGEPQYIHSSFVVGLKSLPVRYRLRPA